MSFKRVLSSLLIITCLIGAGVFIYKSENNRSENENSVSCQGNAFSERVRLSSEFYLSRDLWAEVNNHSEDKTKAPTPEQMKILIADHLRYLQTRWVHIDPQFKLHFSTVSALSENVISMQVSPSFYPEEMKISKESLRPVFVRTIENGQSLESRYLQAAFDKQEIGKSSRAWKISYTVELDFTSCDPQQKKLPTEIYLPKDPYLAMWAVSSGQWVSKKNEIDGKLESITPCASDDFLNDHDPLYYWYYWDLSPVICQQKVAMSLFDKVKVESLAKKEIGAREDLSFDFLKDKAKSGDSSILKASAFFTLIDDNSYLVPDVFGPELSSRVVEVLRLDDFEQARQEIEKLNNYDIALRSGLVFSWTLKNLAKDFTIEVLSVDEFLIRWKLSGKLRESGQGFQVNVVVGSAMEEMNSYAEFYADLSQALLTDDFIYFGGHSGTGKNLSRYRFESKVQELHKSLPAESLPQHQVLMLMTCYSLKYFNETDFPKSAVLKERDFIYTASVPSGYDARLLSGVFEQMDRSLAGLSMVPFSKWSAHYQRDVFMVHRKDVAQ